MIYKLLGKRLVIFDADGTLRRCTVPGQPCPNKPGEWELLSDVGDLLSSIRWGSENVSFGIASNQAGVALGYLSYGQAYDMLMATAQLATGRVHDFRMIEMCEHFPDEGCVCRKPHPTMLFRIMVQVGAHPFQTLYVGDMDSDRECAENAGVDFVWAKDFFGWEGE